MEEISLKIEMVKYTKEQIDQLLACLAAVMGDTRAYECSLNMVAVVLEVNNFLRLNANIVEEEIEDTTEATEETEVQEEKVPDENDEIVLSGGGAE